MPSKKKSRKPSTACEFVSGSCVLYKNEYKAVNRVSASGSTVFFEGGGCARTWNVTPCATSANVDAKPVSDMGMESNLTVLYDDGWI